MLSCHFFCSVNRKYPLNAWWKFCRKFNALNICAAILQLLSYSPQYPFLSSFSKNIVTKSTFILFVSRYHEKYGLQKSLRSPLADSNSLNPATPEPLSSLRCCRSACGSSRKQGIPVLKNLRVLQPLCSTQHLIPLLQFWQSFANSDLAKKFDPLSRKAQNNVPRFLAEHVDKNKKSVSSWTFFSQISAQAECNVAPSSSVCTCTGSCGNFSGCWRMSNREPSPQRLVSRLCPEVSVGRNIL